jgi:UDP-glucose:(glucosyl)LPS alpha-1,2-glucosyltransferase
VSQPPDVAIVLPPRETFSPTASGAVSLLIHRMTQAPSRYRRTVIGAACASPYTDVAFRGVKPGWLPGRRSFRYAAAVARQLGDAPLVEIHNRAEIALTVARLHPTARISLFLHNDPQTMRGLQTEALRQDAATGLAGIVCVSRYLAARFGPGATVLPNFVDLAALPKPAAQRDKLILFVGRLVADKGADSFVEACRQALPDLPAWRAEMIGADRFGADSPATQFTAQLTRAAARAGVTLAGYLPHPEVLTRLAKAAIVVVPSRWQEPFGMTALEAMASGAALICSNRGGLSDVVGDAALPCDPDQPHTIAAAIRSLASHPAECAARAEAGRTRAAQFDLPAAAAALDAYRDALSPPAAHPTCQPSTTPEPTP